MFGIFLPSRIKKNKRCERCTMQYDAKQQQCPHCEGVADGPALEQHIQNHQQEAEANHGLGVIFACIAALILIILLIAAYN